MIIVITGVGGFIGSQLAVKLLEQGHEIIGLDNYISCNGINLSCINNHPNFKFFECDVSKKEEIIF